MGDSIITKRFKSVKCPMCFNIKEIEVKYDFDSMNPYKCHHTEEHYITRIEEQDKLILTVKTRLELLKKTKDEFIIKMKDNTIEIIEFCRKPSKETWGTLSTKIIEMLGGIP